MCIWIGLDDRGHEGQFRWTETGAMLSWSNWFPNQPNSIGNQDCVSAVTTENMQWLDDECIPTTRKYDVLCEYTPTVMMQNP